MSKRSVLRKSILREFDDYPTSALNRDLKKVSKDKWKYKEAKRERRKDRRRGNR